MSALTEKRGRWRVWRAQRLLLAGLKLTGIVVITVVSVLEGDIPFLTDGPRRRPRVSVVNKLSDRPLPITGGGLVGQLNRFDRWINNQELPGYLTVDAERDDYSVVSTRVTIAAEDLCETADVRGGQRALDVACGDGNTARLDVISPGAPSPLKWGTEDGLRDLFGPSQALTVHSRVFRYRFASIDRYLDALLPSYSPFVRMSERTTQDAFDRFRHDFAELLATWNEADDGSLVLPMTYIDALVDPDR